ncbi:MAG TPA: hypothetical protein VEQ37_13555 [Actinomycetota bacterium]|nr:hypothetical protein [Actinomycetota bacterium]
MEALRVLGALLGGLIALATSASVLQTLVTPGGRVARLFRTVDKLIDAAFRMAGHSLPHYGQRYRILAFQAPLVLAVTLISWLASYLVAYGLVLWPATGNLAAAFRESGSSLFTLGFASTRGGGPTVIDFVAGATGLIVVALQIAYLPALYSAFNRRETEVTLIAVRAGLPAWGPELLARSRYTITIEELPEFYRQWERWAADVAESHSSYPILLRFRSPHPKASWLLALLSVMDSAALWSAVAPDDLPVQARLCLAMGFRCLRQLASTVGIPYDEDPMPDAGIQLTREEFDQGISRLQSVDFPMMRTPDEAWPHFQGWRVNYEPIAYRLAYLIDAVPAAWSGPRRSGEPPVTPRLVINRTPENPEGAPPTYRTRT